MTSWYAKVINDPTFDSVLDACDYFDAEYENAAREIDINLLRGQRVEEVAKRLPGLVGYRCRQMQELDAILDYVEIKQLAVKGARRRHYLEHYNRALTPSTAEKYVECDEEVLALAMLYNQVKLVRNKFQALSKEHEYLHFEIGNITKLLAAGVNDALY